jgi:hypothetical protein
MPARDAGWLAVALVLHAAAFMSTARVRTTEVAPPEDTVVILDEGALEQLPAPRTQDDEGAQPTGSDGALPTRLRDRARRGPEASVETPIHESSASAPTDVAPEETGERPSLRGLSNDALGIGPRNAFVGTALVAPHAAATAPAPDHAAVEAEAARAGARKLDDLFRKAQREHDVSLGLGSGGSILGAIEEATRTNDLRENVSATFEVQTDATGRITDVRVMNGSDDGWNEVARRTLVALRDRALKVPSHEKGVAVTVRVTSRYLLPGGESPDSPDFAVDKKGPRLQFDFANIGARPQRVVHAHIIEEHSL